MLYEQLVKRGIKVYEEFYAWKLVEDGGRIQGVIAWDLLNGGLKAIAGTSVVLATGGIGRIYRITTNAYACTGDGTSMALRLGLPLKDMEFMQFHPTTLYPTGILMTEGCRGEGAYLINKDGERFMERYAPNALELASRDVVSRSEQTEIDQGRGVNGSVMLDMRHLGASKIIDRLPGSRELAITYAGVDPIYEPVPVRPGAHYHMGGVATDKDGLTELPGLYAAGETACVSVHGANRLGGNSLMETITFGRRAGRAAAEASLIARAPAGVPESALSDAQAELDSLLARKDGERPWKIRDELGASMLDNFGVFRREEQMKERGRDHRRAPRAVREGRRRGQGRGVQQRPDPGARARRLPRARRLHARAAGSSGRRAGERTRGPTTSRIATTRASSSIPRSAGSTGSPSHSWSPVTITKWEPVERSY